MEVEVEGGLQGTTTVCAQPGLHYRSKSIGGGATGVTDLTFVCVLGGGVAALLLHRGKKEKVVGGWWLQKEKAAVMTSTHSFL